MIKKLSAAHQEIEIIADAYFEIKIGHCSILRRINKISTCLHLDILSESTMIRESAMIRRFPALRKT